METRMAGEAESQAENIILVPEEGDTGMRLDAFLAKRIENWSRSRLAKLIENGDVLVNQNPAKTSYKIHENDEIEVDLVELPAQRFEPENIPLEIVYEDESLAVINKPAGMVVHPGAGVSSGTLANALAYHFGIDSINTDAQSDEQSMIQDLKSKIGIVHRLDKDTSGLIVVAKNEEVHDALSVQFKSREVEKSYFTLVHGSPRENHGKIDRPIARDRWHRTKMTVAANGRPSLSLWKVRERFEKFTLLEVDIKTGRTHQIRVHLASINHPVVGDATYNEGRDNTIAEINIRKAVQKMNRFFLHSERLSFTHPVTKNRLRFTADMPAELKELLDLL